MTRDWVLTLLVIMSPYLLAVTIAVLVMIWRAAQSGLGRVGQTRLGHAAERTRRTMGAQRLPLAPNGTATERKVRRG